jgi:cob(I)alamin adenosyltransferase
MNSYKNQANDHQKKIYTRTGDQGKTSLLRCTRVPKYNARIEANGMIDELNSWIGYIRSINEDNVVDTMLGRLQPRLNLLCSDVAAPIDKIEPGDSIPRAQAHWDRELENEMGYMEKDLMVLNHAVLPGGNPTGASLHLARTVCRRAELLLVFLQDEEGNVNPEAIRFINRLSDYLFILSQWSNYRALKGEVDEMEAQEKNTPATSYRTRASIHH